MPSSDLTKTLSRSAILQRVRRVFGKSCLGHLSDDQCVEYYEMLDDLRQNSSAPYARMVEWVKAQGIQYIDERPDNTLKLAVRNTSNKLFGKLRNVVKTSPKLARHVQQVTSEALERIETTEKDKIKEDLQAQFDPLRETIAATIRFREEFDYWAKKSRKNKQADPQLPKLGTLWRESISDSVELFKTLHLIDDDFVENAKTKFNIGSIQVVLNQGNQQRSGDLLDSFLSRIAELPELTDGGNCEAGIDATDGELRPSEADIIPDWQGAQSLTERDEIHRGVPGEPATGDDRED